MPRIEECIEPIEQLEANSLKKFKEMIAKAKQAMKDRKWNTAKSYIGRAQNHAMTREQDHQCNKLQEVLRSRQLQTV